MAEGTVSPRDSVCETTSTQGLGSYSLQGAVTSCRAFSDAFANGDQFTYCCLADVEDKSFEVGIGSYNSATDQVDRILILRSWLNDSDNGQNPVQWGAGQRVIYVTPITNDDGGGPLLIDSDNLSDVESESASRSNLSVPGDADDNTWSGTNEFTGKVTTTAVRLPNTLGSDNGAGAITGTDLRYRTSTGTDMSFTGTLFRTVVSGQAGSFWVDGDDAHYVDENGDERTIPGTSQGSALNALEGSAWVETTDFHFIEQDHGDHTDGAHTDTDPTDRLAHIDTSHSDVTHSDSHSDTHADTHSDTHNDHSDSHSDTHSDGHVDHSDIAHVDSHGDSHTDTHSDTTTHTDTHTDTHSDTHSDVEHSDQAHTDQPVTHTDT